MSPSLPSQQWSLPSTKRIGNYHKCKSPGAGRRLSVVGGIDSGTACVNRGIGNNIPHLKATSEPSLRLTQGNPRGWFPVLIWVYLPCGQCCEMGRWREKTFQPLVYKQCHWLTKVSFEVELLFELRKSLGVLPKYFSPCFNFANFRGEMLLSDGLT